MFFFRKKREQKSKAESARQMLDTTTEPQWAELPAYVEATLVEELKATAIAAAIVAGDAAKSQFVVKKVLVRNPEVSRISVIAAAVVESTHPLKVIRIAERKNSAQN